MITFDNFFNYIKKHDISQNELIRKGVVNARLLNYMKNNKSVTTESLNKICTALNCTINDIMSNTKDDENISNEPINESYTDEEKYIIESYRKCNETGKQRIIEQVNFMQQNFPRGEDKSSTLKIG